MFDYNTNENPEKSQGSELRKKNKVQEIKPETFSIACQTTKFLKTLGYNTNNEVWIKLAPSRAVFKAKFGLELELYPQEKTQDPEWDGKDPDTKFLKDARGGSVWKNKDRKISKGLSYLETVANHGEEVFFIVNHAKGGIGQGHCSRFSTVFFECDDRPIEEQWLLINSIYETYELMPCSVVFTGGKSLHVYYRLTTDVSDQQWRELQRKLIVLNNSDPALVNLNREMRLPGFYRKSKQKYQELQFYSEAKYSYEEINSKLSAKFPHGLSDKRFSDWKRQKDEGILFCKEEDLPSSIKLKEIENHKSRLILRNLETGVDLVDLVQEANQKASQQDFESLFPHNFKTSAGKSRGRCPWHESKSGTAGWLGKNNSGVLSYHCPQCTDNQGLQLFNYFSKLETGNEVPRGPLFVETAKKFLNIFSIQGSFEKSIQFNNNKNLEEDKVKNKPEFCEITEKDWLDILVQNDCKTRENPSWEVVKNNPAIPINITNNPELCSHGFPTIKIDLSSLVQFPEEIQQYCQQKRKLHISVDNPRGKAFIYQKIQDFCQKVKKLTSISPTFNGEPFELYFNQNVIKTPNIVLNQEFLDESIFEKWDTKILGISSPCGTGKTEVMKNLIEKLWEENYTVYFPSHRIALSKAQASRLGFRYIDDPVENNLPPNKRNSLGFVVDSFWSEGKVKINPLTNIDLITEKYAIIIDESEQFFEHLAISTTQIAKHRAEAFIYTEFLISNADKIVLLDADLSNISLNYVKSICEANDSDIYVIKNEFKKGFNCNFYPDKNPNRLLENLMARAATEKLLVLTDSQTVEAEYSTQNLESLIQKTYPQLKILRIDRDTINGINMHEIKNIVTQYDLVIGSPSIATGVDINIKGYFSEIYGFFKGVMAENSVRQMLFRCRDMEIDRHLWIGKMGLNFPHNRKDTDPKFLFEAINEEFELHMDVSNDPLRYKKSALNTCNNGQELYSKIVSKINATNLYYSYVILKELEKSGCTIKIIPPIEPKETKEIGRQIKETKINNVAKRNSGIMTAPIISEEEYNEIQHKKSLTKEEEYKKVLYKIMNALKLEKEEVTEEIIEEYFKGIIKKLRLRRLVIESDGDQKSKELDRERIEAIFESGVVCKQDFNKKQKSILVSLLKKIEIGNLLNENTVTAASPCVRTVIENLSKNLHVAEILLGIKAGTSPIVAIKKILELIGVKLTRQGREAKGQRLWIYKLEKNPVFETIMERWKQEERVSSKNGIYNIDNTFGTETEIVKTDPPNNGVVITGESSQQHMEIRERTEQSKIRDQESENLGTKQEKKVPKVGVAVVWNCMKGVWEEAIIKNVDVLVNGTLKAFVVFNTGWQTYVWEWNWIFQPVNP